MSNTVVLAGFRIRERVRGSLWFLPGLIVGAAAGLALLLIAAEPEVSSFWEPVVFGGDAQGARDVLSTIAGSMVTFVGTVFSITVIVLQLASTQFSPRALRTFLRDRRSQVPLGVFLGTLVYCLMVLWSVRSSGTGVEEFVPRMAMTGAAVLVLVSLVLFVYYIDHVAQSIRVATVVRRIGAETLEVLEQLYPSPFDPAVQTGASAGLRGRGEIVASASAGVVMAVDIDAARRLACTLDGCVEIAPRVGDFVATGAPIARWTGAQRPEPQALHRLATLGRERTMQHDLAFGLRQLVDVAVKALSPGINDPTTASQAVDQIHEIVRRLVQRSLQDELVRDDDDVVRVVRREHTWEELLQLAFEEILDNARSSVQVRRRVRGSLLDIISVAPAQRMGALREQLMRASGELDAA